MGPTTQATCFTFILLHYFHLTNFFWMFVEGKCGKQWKHNEPFCCTTYIHSQRKCVHVYFISLVRFTYQICDLEKAKAGKKSKDDFSTKSDSATERNLLPIFLLQFLFLTALNSFVTLLLPADSHQPADEIYKMHGSTTLHKKCC